MRTVYPVGCVWVWDNGVKESQWHRNDIYEQDVAKRRCDENPQFFFVDLELVFCDAAVLRGRKESFESLQANYHGNHCH